MKNVKLRHSRLSKSSIEIQNKLENLRTRSKTTYIKKLQITNVDITKKDLYQFFRKAPGIRTNQEIEIFADYLSKHYQYFKNLKNEESQLKVEGLTKICRLEKIFKGDSIINYGEIGDKFYIVLEGTVEVFKPKYIEIEVLPNEFISLLNKIKETEGNLLKYERIKEKNKIFFETYSERSKHKEISSKNSNTQNSQSSNRNGSKPSSTSRSEIDKLIYKQVFLMEDEEKMGEYGEGFSFGDIALIQKTTRNATIKAKEYCILLTIEKNEYNKAMLEFQSKKLNKEIEDFIRTYSFFKDFSHEKIINLFNCFSKKTIYKGEYLYQQNKKDECIYIINNGLFSVSCNISFCWLSDYLDYISYEDKNILEYLIQNKKIKYTESINLIKNCYNKLTDNYLPDNFDKYDLWEKIGESQTKDNLYRIKKDEEKLNDPENIYNIEIKKINYEEILGIEEVFDFKKRFCSIKCLSDKADIKYITIYEFLKLIINLGDEELKYLLTMVNERKDLLKTQIIKAIKNIERKIIFNFDIRYENLIKEAENKKTSEAKKKNQLFSTLKFKGYKYSLHDILDNNIPSLDNDDSIKGPDNIFKIKNIKKNRSAEMLLKSLYTKRKDNNKVKLKIIKNIFNYEKLNINNKKICQINPRISIRNSAANSKNPFQKKIKYSRNSKSTINFSNTGESLFVKIKKMKTSNYSMDNNIKTSKYSFEGSQLKINFEVSKTVDNSPIIQIIKDNNNKISQLKNIALDDKNTKYSERQIKDSYETTNLPNLFEKKMMSITNSNFKSILKKEIKKDKNNYKDFYHFFNHDKNFFVGTEFQKPLINGFYTFKNKNFFENNKAYK